MNKREFINTMSNTLSAIPDNKVRADVLKGLLNHSNIGFESALKSVEYFYNELFEIYTNRPSQFEGKILVRGNHISYTQNDKILLEICSNKTNLAFGGIVIINHEYIYYSNQFNVINNVSFKYFITSFLNFGEVLALVSNTRNTKSIKSFDSKLTDIQLEALYKALINEYIHSETTLEQFKAVFTAQPVESIKPIKWALLNPQNEPHKTALRELLELLLEDTIHKDMVNACFTDAKGNKIELLKRHKTYSNYYSDLEDIIKEAKK